YEPPLEVARRKLMGNPELIRTLGAKAPEEDPQARRLREFAEAMRLQYDIEIPVEKGSGYSIDDFANNPELLVNLTEKDPLYKAFADWEYLNAIGEATKAGQAAYRVSKAPWLEGGKTQSVLDTLGMKLNASLKPGVEGVKAFVLGVDDTGYFRLGRHGAENQPVEMRTGGSGPLVGEHTGGIPEGETIASRNHMLVEEYPELFASGQMLGAFAPWSLVAKGFNMIARAAPTTAPVFRSPYKPGMTPRTPPKPLGIVRGPAVAGGTGAGASVAVQGVQEGADAAASLMQSGGEETGTTMPEVMSRLGGAAVT